MPRTAKKPKSRKPQARSTERAGGGPIIVVLAADLKMSKQTAKLCSVRKGTKFVRTGQHRIPRRGEYAIYKEGTYIAREGTASWSSNGQAREIVERVN